ncbi:MAG TPA: STAS domain-containing protein [Candidatus Wallbacteria bacterium]|nr:STAS domain-containing protein [Candidatus Wallbacteria bacterium]
MVAIDDSSEKLPFTYNIITRKEKNIGGVDVAFDEISLAGKLEFLSNPELEKNFCEMADIKTDRIVLNLKEINFINSLGLNFILNEYDKCTKKGKKFFISNAGNYVKKVLMITKLDQIFKMLANSDECVNL